MHLHQLDHFLFRWCWGFNQRSLLGGRSRRRWTISKDPVITTTLRTNNTKTFISHFIPCPSTCTLPTIGYLNQSPHKLLQIVLTALSEFLVQQSQNRKRHIFLSPSLIMQALQNITHKNAQSIMSNTCNLALPSNWLATLMLTLCKRVCFH